VEKKDAPAHEARVVDRLNRFFDALLVHADPKWVRLEETFQRTADIGIDWMYTGFVTPKPAPGDRDRIRASLGLGPADALIVASAGSGAVGAPLLQAVAATAVELQDRSVFWQMFTGPYLDEAAFQNLLQRANRRLRVARFAADFLAYLAAADISISMGGYNTTMNILAARTPALIYPFQQNREQRLRAERLGRTGVIQILDESDLNPSRMTEWVLRLLDRPKPSAVDIDLDGAARTAAWIAQRFPSTGQPETTPWH
jgi:predicted glycosyltransferase